MTTKASILNTIRDYCKEVCCAGDETSWKECPGDNPQESVNCVLWSYRFGRDPNPNASKVARGRELSKKTLSKQQVVEADQ